jgi:carboxypeptidase PM20D1
VGLLLVVFLAILLIRTATVSSKQPVALPLAPAAIDEKAAALALSLAVKRKTISTSLEQASPPEELEGLHADLKTSFPKVHSTLVREVVGTHSLLYTWKGSDSSKKPIILCAHMDVVPVEPGTEAAWTHPAYDGVVDAGFVWGRGTIDDKGSLIGIFTAVETLLNEGFTPVSTVYLAFGQDEEISGKFGAGKIADALAARGVHAELALDEGSALVEGVVTQVPAPVAAIGIAEKGYVSVDLKVEIPGGHSSTPARDNALTVLGRGLERLAADPMPARIDGATEQFFAWAAPEMGFGSKLALSNLWALRPIVKAQLGGSETLGAAIRTTTAITMFNAGVKDNVVPAMATATVNFRVLPGDTTDDVLAHVKSAIADDRVVTSAQEGSRTEPSKVSRADSRGFGLLARTVREIFPGTVVAPSLVLGATDGRFYAKVADDVYRFVPFRFSPSDISRIHGKDERLAVAGLADGARFYRRFLVVAAGPP